MSLQISQTNNRKAEKGNLFNLAHIGKRKLRKFHLPLKSVLSPTVGAEMRIRFKWRARGIIYR